MYVVCGMALVAGCASQTKHQWLTFFFDGVPGAPGVAISTRVELPAKQITDWPPIWRTPPVLGPLAAGAALVVHLPYAERRCIECHASNYSQRLKGDVSEICTGCHKAFLVKAKFTHAPIADGQCTVCHEPHQGAEKFLLVKSVRELCFDCHERESVLKTKACAQAEGRSCTGCHDPHQEDRRFLLFPPGQTSPVRKMTPEQ